MLGMGIDKSDRAWIVDHTIKYPALWMDLADVYI